jgi:hypothetical protein
VRIVNINILTENRNNGRKQLTIPITVQLNDGHVVYAYTRNVSRGGMFIESAVLTEARKYFEIKIYTKGMSSKKTINLLAAVVHRSEDGIGIKFLRSDRIIDFLINALMRDRTQPMPNTNRVFH